MLIPEVAGPAEKVAAAVEAHACVEEQAANLGVLSGGIPGV
jgi:hypothetical protein